MNNAATYWMKNGKRMSEEIIITHVVSTEAMTDVLRTYKRSVY